MSRRTKKGQSLNRERLSIGTVGGLDLNRQISGDLKALLPANRATGSRSDDYVPVFDRDSSPPSGGLNPRRWGFVEDAAVSNRRISDDLDPYGEVLSSASPIFPA
jgi:hypothetical protein